MSAVVCAPQWTATRRRRSDACRNRSADAAPLLDAEQDPLPRRSQREQSVETGRDVEVAERRERVVVERAAVLPQGRDRRGERTSQHGRTLSSALMASLRIERDGHLLRVTLAKPERRNAFDAALIAELTDAFADVGDARAVLLEGDGPSFCAGADVEWQRASIDLSYEENVADAMRLYSMLEAIDSCPAPVVCCVHGFALGGGSGLVACADVAVAWPDAVFGFTEVRLGIIPAVISPFVLPKIGSAARRYFVTGEQFDAAEALRIGLVSEVAADAGERVESVVRDVLAGGPIAVREAKRLVRERPQGEATAQLAAARRSSDRFRADEALRIGLVSEVSEDAGERVESIVQDVLAGGPVAVREAKKLVREQPTGEATAHIAAARRTSDEGQDGLRAFLERRSAGWL